MRLSLAAAAASAAALASASLLASNAAYGQDADRDGVPDAVDVFPCDGTSAAESYSPAQGQHGMLLAEDFWPVRLDDDYQDAVVTYNYGFKLDASGRLALIRATYNVLAAGGVIDLGLGVQLAVPRQNAISVAATIAGQPASASVRPDANLTVEISTDVRAALFPPGTPSIVNARANVPRVSSVGPIELLIELSPAVSVNLGLSPFDLFLFRTSDTRHEVHLSTYCGTSSMNAALFGTGIDRSAVPGGPCFIDQNGLPTVLHVPALVAYPLEQINIASLYPAIVPWAASGGTTNGNWYTQAVTAFAYPNPLPPSFNGASQLARDLSCFSGDILVSSEATAQVLRYDGATGAFGGVFASQPGLSLPEGLDYGPDGNLYVASFGSNRVYRFNGIAGAFIDIFVQNVPGPVGLRFGPDGNLYVGARGAASIQRFNGATGAAMGTFASGGGLSGPDDLIFHPTTGDLIVSSRFSNQLLRYHGTTGAFMGIFAQGNGLNTPEQLVIDSAGRVYVVSRGSQQILRYAANGTFLGAFAQGGGMNQAVGMIIGLDGNLYVSDFPSASILRFDGTTGAALGVVVPSGSGGLSVPTFMTRTR